MFASTKSFVVGICLFLAVIVWSVFGQTLRHEFVNFDDDEYVYENPHVAGGLTFQGIAWAFTRVHSANWHPITWVSHMLDCELHGLSPGGHHLTNVLLHIGTAVLLFLVLRQLLFLPQAAMPQTSALWCSAFVAAVFAIHPLRVESVAWISERKDVLSGLFFMLTLAAYIRYVRRPSIGRYGVVALMFALALMSKPMVVTLPFVLLLLDYWPLKRFAQVGGSLEARRLIIEKIPLLILCGVSCAVTLLAQKQAIAPMPLSMRIGNAFVSYLVYVRQTFYPVDLAAYYPHPEEGLSLPLVAGAVAMVIAVTVLVVIFRRQRPWLLTGWLWYLGMLIPAIGIVQVGSQAHADRYTYLPQIGLVLMLAVGVTHARISRWLLGASMAIVVALLFIARTQTAHWLNSESLWRHALSCTSNNVVALNNLGSALLQKGAVDDAIVLHQRALEIKPDYTDAHVNLGNALLRKGEVNEAIVHYQQALRATPDEAGAHFNLGNALLRKGRVDEAITHYRRAVEIHPDYAEAWNHLGNALLQLGRSDEAIVQYRRALQINPAYTKARNNLGYAFLHQGNADEAIAQLQTAVSKADNPEAYYNLGNAFLMKGNLSDAITQYQEALRIEPRRAEVHYKLALVLFKTGNDGQAIMGFQDALDLEPDRPDVLNDLAWLLATSPQASLRDGPKAVELARRANQLTGGGNPNILKTLAAACAEAGRFEECLQNVHKAINLAESIGRKDMVDELKRQLKLYEAGLAFKD